MNNRQLPFADAATIVRAHQKDAYFESSYRNQIQDLFQILKGQRFINNYPQELTVLSKALYLFLTTLIGARTLGEEYVDLIYVSKSGKKLPKFLTRFGFIISYAIIPYFINKIINKLKNKDEKLYSNYYNILDTLLNFHIALFYFKGEFYSLSKRLFGLRYAFGHYKEPEKMQTNNYSFLGGLIIVQFIVKGLINLKNYNNNEAKDEKQVEMTDKIENIDQLSQISNNFNKDLIIDLSDPNELAYLPESSRSCMLCLSPMVNPSAANCGHLFCWDCIVDWIRENPECPLCRQQCLEQHLLPLK
ncbi:unnamed protein product [Candida verbasci]|uniref:RING-type E3 ubiquitin transferase n=1 Tax=Candida verbasci TaxID=1227364 RepID=A0A9W4TZ29_9ASCO|nr:unnamed protein product [Candida verbasci]